MAVVQKKRADPQQRSASHVYPPEACRAPDGALFCLK
jgi:hypothetical protein